MPNKNVEFGKRLAKLRSSLDIDQKVAAERIGVSYSGYQRYEAGYLPTQRNMNKISSFYNCSQDWLVLGGRGMPQAEDGAPPGNDTDAFAFVPKAAARLNAGGGNVVYDEGMGEVYAFRRDWLSTVATAAANVVLFDVDGDSMFPTLPDRCTVMIDMGRKALQNGYIYAIGVDDVIQVKRLALRPGAVRVISDNRAAGYEPYDVPAAALRIVGRVIWVGINL